MLEPARDGEPEGIQMNFEGGCCIILMPPGAAFWDIFFEAD